MGKSVHFCARACEDATKGYGLAVDDFCKLPFLLLETAATVQQREKALDVFDETFRSNVIQMEDFCGKPIDNIKTENILCCA